VAPLCEELLFRGLLQRVLTQRAGLVTGVVGSGLAFGLLHLSDPASVPPLIGLGLGLALLRARTGSLWPAVVAHTLNNGLAMALVLSGLA
jgi:membrane protease YdiL (CAAX protease family)